MSSTGRPLTDLRPVMVDVQPTYYSLCGGIGAGIFWFIVVAVILYLILYSTKPSLLRNSSGDADPAKVLIASLFIALLVVIILWILRTCCTRGY